ncbi:MAG TPA: hypothetical protein VLH39_00265 [Magnetospirillaceae bacterium]|nr:hypothetical protein [Magnetospirillaceae bacterium]
MAHQKVRFEDNIWYVRRRIALVEDALKIQPDADLFAESVLDDAVLAERAIRELVKLLQNSLRLVDRAEFLVLLSRGTKVLADAVSGLARGEGDLSGALVARGEETAALAAGLRQLHARIRDSANDALDTEAPDSDVVSRDELSELLRGEDTAP